MILRLVGIVGGCGLANIIGGLVITWISHGQPNIDDYREGRS